MNKGDTNITQEYRPIGNGGQLRTRWSGKNLIIDLNLPEGCTYRVVSRKAHSDTQGLRARLEEFFIKLTKLPVPESKTSANIRWWTPIREIIKLAESDEQEAKRLMEDAVKEMRRSNLTISAPQSIMSILRANYASNKTSEIEVW